MSSKGNIVKIILLLTVRSSLVLADEPTHSRPIDSSKNRPIDNQSVFDCSTNGFKETYEPFHLDEEYENYQTTQGWYLFSKRPALKKSAPLPIIPITEHKEAFTRYTPPSRPGGLGATSTGYQLKGWRHRAPYDSTFRSALAQALDCELDKKNDFGEVLHSWLSNESLFKAYKDINGKAGDWSNVDEDLAKQRKMKEIYESLRTEIKETSSNPLIKKFMSGMFKQIQLTEKEMREKPRTKPLSFDKSFLEQVAAAHAIVIKEPKTEEERAFLKYLIEKFMVEPRFSYLMNPVIASFINKSIAQGVVNPEGRNPTAAGLKDQEKALKSILGDSYIFDKPDYSAGYLKFNPEKKEVELAHSEPSQFIDKTLDRLFTLLQEADPKKQKTAQQNIQRNLLNYIAGIDSVHMKASPEQHALRESALHALARLHGGPEAQNVSEALGYRSSQDPESTLDASRILGSLAKTSGLSVNPAAIEKLSHYDPVLRIVAAGLLPNISKLDSNGKKDLEMFLQTGSSSDLVRLIFKRSELFNAAVKELGNLGADKEAVSLLRDMEFKFYPEKYQAEKYNAIRQRLKEGFLKKELKDFSQKEKADLLALNLLDELGLYGVTARDSENSAPDRYDSGLSLQYLKAEQRKLEQFSKTTGKGIEELEKDVREHVTSLYGKSTGLTPEVRHTILERLFESDDNLESKYGGDQFVPKEEQLKFLKFASDLIPKGGKDSHVERKAREIFGRELFRPVTQSNLSLFTGNHTGRDATVFFEQGDLTEEPQTQDRLKKAKFFDPKNLESAFAEYQKYQEKLDGNNRKLAEAVLDFARTGLQTEIKKISNGEIKPTPEIEGSLGALKLLIDLYLEPAVSDSQLAKYSHEFIEALNPKSFARQQFLAKMPENARSQIEVALNYLNSSDFGSRVLEKSTLSAKSIEGLKDAESKWRSSLEGALKGLGDDEKIRAEELLGRFDSFRKAVTDNQLAILRNTNNSEGPNAWLDQTRHFFKGKLKQFAGGDTEVLKALDAAARKIEEEARESAKQKHVAREAVIHELTAPGGKLKTNNLDFDPVRNAVVIHDDSFIDDNVLKALSGLGDYNLVIEPERNFIPFQGQNGLEDWLRKKRIMYQYSEPSKMNQEGGFLVQAEPLLPLNEKTAVRVFRRGDGTYEYGFRDAAEVKDRLEKDKQALDSGKTEYLRDKDAFGKGWEGAWHAGKVYFGNIGRWKGLSVGLNSWYLPELRGGDPRFESSESEKLRESWNKTMKALEEVEKAGHIEDETGMSGKARVGKNRRKLKDALHDESASIESFVNKAELIHELTSLIVTLPAGGSLGLGGAAARVSPGLGAALEMNLVKLALKSETVAGRFAARALLTTAKAAKGYAAATKTAAKTAGLFTGMGVGTELLVTGGQYLFGEGPRMIRDKENLAKAGKIWRKYEEMPMELDFHNNKQAYEKALFEYQIEEAMDPDGNGIPNDHDATGLNYTINGSVSPSDLLWSPVEQFAGNWRFFQGLNVSKQIMPGGGLPTEMAFAPLWTRANPFFDPNFDKLKRQERARVDYVQRNSGKTEREKSVPELLAWDVLTGGVEGARFGGAGKVAQLATRALPKNKVGTALGVLSFILTDEATKYGVNSIMHPGQAHNPFDLSNPNLAKEWAHTFTVGSYIGYQMVQGAHERNYYQDLKSKIGIPDVTRKAESKQEPSSSESSNPRSIQSIIKTEFGGNEAQGLLFLRQITDSEIAKAPIKVQREFFNLMRGLEKKALDDLNDFAKSIGSEEVAGDVQKLASATREIKKLEEKAQKGSLSPQEVDQLGRATLEQESSLYNIQKVFESTKVQSDRARKINDRILRNRQWASLNEEEVKTVQANWRIISEYEKNGARVQGSILRLDTMETFRKPAQKVAAILSPTAGFAQHELKSHPKALAALAQETKIRDENPTLWNKTVGVLRGLEKDHILPQVTRMPGPLSHIPEGFQGKDLEASNLIQSARKRNTDPETREELLDLLRIIDPVKAVKIETQEEQKKK